MLFFAIFLQILKIKFSVSKKFAVDLNSELWNSCNTCMSSRYVKVVFIKLKLPVLQYW